MVCIFSFTAFLTFSIYLYSFFCHKSNYIIVFFFCQLFFFVPKKNENKHKNYEQRRTFRLCIFAYTLRLSSRLTIFFEMDTDCLEHNEPLKRCHRFLHQITFCSSIIVARSHFPPHKKQVFYTSIVYYFL